MKNLFVAVLMLFLTSRAAAQIIYFNTIQGQIYTLNVATCASTLVATGPAFNDMAVGPGGLIYGLSGQEIWIINPATGTNTLLGTYPAVISPTLEYGQNGQLYLIDQLTNSLIQVNPANGNAQTVGTFPSGWVSLGDLVFFNGSYFGTFSTPSGSQLAEVNITNPAASSFVTVTPGGANLVAGSGIQNANCPRMFWFSTLLLNQPSTLWQYDLNTDTWTQICPGFSFTVGGADTPNGYSFPLTCNTCTTNAGNVTSQNFNLCGTSPSATVPFSGGQVLDSDDILRYILFTNLSDPDGSILQQSATPVFNFDANTMVLGQTYYLGTIAGNNLSGSVNLADPCLDLSNNFAQVTWRALPTVSFSLQNPTLCPGGCIQFSASFTGVAPFSLAYENPFTGASQNQVFTGTTGGILLCSPVATSEGNYNLQAVSLSDANCVCN